MNISNVTKTVGYIFKNKRRIYFENRNRLEIENSQNNLKNKEFNTVYIKELEKLRKKDVPKDVKIGKISFITGNSPINDYYNLIMLIRIFDVKKVFEIGTFMGTSAFNMANNLPEDGQVFTLNLPPEHKIYQGMGIPKDFISKYTKDQKKITQLYGDSSQFEFSKYIGSFDMVFIDGDHTTEMVTNDTRKSLGLLKGKTSLMVWHDYMGASTDVRYDVFQGIVDGLGPKEAKKAYHIYNSNIAIYSPSFKTNMGRRFSKKDILKYSAQNTFQIEFSPDG
jgi:predicted O-methyltransferase YrrM